jgi:hypothetical protein
VSLFDALLWGREMEDDLRKSSPSSPPSPTQGISGPLFQSPFWDEGQDAYARRAHLALDAICGIPSPVGLIGWLRQHSAFLYVRLTREVPDEISRAWNAKVPYEDFDALCFNLVETHRRAVAIYCAACETEGRKSETRRL